MKEITINGCRISIDTLKNNLELEVPYTYKKITTLTGLPYKGTSVNSKNSQLHQLSRGLSYEIRDKKYYITEIFEEFESEEIRSVWTSFINIQIMCYLRECEGHCAIHSTTQWFELLGFVNSNFARYGQHPERLLPLMQSLPGFGDYKKHAFYNNNDIFRQRVRRFFRQKLIMSLEDLRDKRIIKYNPDCIMIYDGVINQKKHDGVIERHEASPEEISEILDIEKKALKSVNCDSYSMVKLRGAKVEQEYHEKCDSLFRNWFLATHHYIYPYTRYGHEIQVIYSKKYLDEQIDQERQNIEKALLNDKACTWANNNADLLSANRSKTYGHDKRFDYYDSNVQYELADRCIKLQD